MPKRWFAAGLLAVVLLAGCGQQHVCTLIGAEDGVTFEVDPALAATLPATGTVDVRMCLDSRCTDRESDLAVFRGRPVRWFLPTDLGDTARSVQLSLLVTDSRGRRLVDAAGTTTTHRVQPNGPGCEPVAWQARVVVRGSPGDHPPYLLDPAGGPARRDGRPALRQARAVRADRAEAAG